MVIPSAISYRSGPITWISILLLLTGSFLCSCKKDNPVHKTGIAIAYDIRNCVCCGGLFVEYQSDTLLFPQIPDKIITWEKAYGFPLLLSFDFEKRDNNCGLDWYKMTYVELLSHH